MLIVGVDPGGTTGLALVRTTDGGDEIDIVETQHIVGMGSIQWIDNLLRDRVPIQVAAEAFTIAERTLRGTRSGVMEALYTIGAIRYLCYKHGVAFTLQTPAQAKNAYTDSTLRALKIWRANPHERDALRHALLYARTHGLWEGRVA